MHFGGKGEGIKHYTYPVELYYICGTQLQPRHGICIQCNAFIKVIKTIVMFVMIVVWNVLMEIVRAVRGDDLYQPVVSQTMDETS
jgi:hypothetical protein